MEVLTELIRICKKYNLTYYATWGTLVGAVRHQGFVPWDDDIDIALKRADYMRLIEVLPAEIPQSWKLSSMYMQEGHNHQISCLMNSRKVIKDAETLSKFHGCPYIVGVDIYPLDLVSRDPEMEKMQKLLYNAVYDAAQRYPELEKTGELAKYLPRIEELCGVTFNDELPLRKQLWRLSDKIAMMFTEEECDHYTFFLATFAVRQIFV